MVQWLVIVSTTIICSWSGTVPVQLEEVDLEGRGKKIVIFQIFPGKGAVGEVDSGTSGLV